MIKKVVLIAILSFLSFGFQMRSCQQQDDQPFRLGPEEKADLVFFFKKGTNGDAIFEFERTVVGIPNKTGSGYDSLPGEASTVAITINGFDGEAICFKPNATDEQKASIKKAVTESPLIYKVYDNIVPNEIKDL